jgi:hypothetical protein
MRVMAITVLVAAVLAAASPAAAAQDAVGRAAGDVPSSLFEPPPEGVPGGARTLDGDAGGAPMAVAVALLSVALVAGFYAGSANRTRRS